MSDHHQLSRVNKYEKRRKTTKSISILVLIASILILTLIGKWIFGGSNDADTTTKDDQNISQGQFDNEENNNGNDVESSEANATIDEDDKDSDVEEEDEENQTEVEKEMIETSDANVMEAYTTNWQPIGTEQSGPHTTQFKKDTQDWLEMERAIQVATGLSEDNMVTHFIGNGGEPNKVVGTVTSNDKTEIYRVYLTWVDEQGWQPTKVEQLREIR